MNSPREYIPSLYDTHPDSAISISMDIGIIPVSYPHSGKYVVTIQALPLPDRKTADAIAAALKDAIQSRLGIKFDVGTHVA